MAAGLQIRQQTHVFYGWWIVLAAAIALFWGAPVAVFSFSVFLKPLMRDFHTGRAAVSLAVTLGALGSAFTAPLMRWLIDRYGVRRIILPVTAVFGLALLSARLIATKLWHLYVFFAVLGVLLNGVGPIPYGKVIACWFDRHRGLALGLMMLGIGSGAIIMPIFAQALISNLGWRNAYATMGAAVLLVSVPVIAIVIRERPQDMGLLPDGGLYAESAGGHGFVQAGFDVGGALRDRSFWLMLTAFFLAGAGVQACLTHFAAMLTDRGATIQMAAAGSSLMGAAVLVGRLGTGYLLDRFFAPKVAALFFAGAAFGIALLWLGGATTPTFAGAAFVGLGLGAEVDLIAYLVSRYFGLKSFGKLYSLAFGFFTFSIAVGPLAMGAGFDLIGSYRTPLTLFFAATLVASLLMTRLGPYRFEPRRV